MMRQWWRRPRRAMVTAMGTMALLAGFATTASAQPDPPPVISPPAPGITPGAVAQPDGTGGYALNVLYTASDGSVWVIQGAGSLAVPYGGRLIGAPAPLYIGGADDAILNFGRGTDSQLWYNRTTTGFSQPYSPLGGRLTSKPGAASLGGNAYAVFVRGTDGAVWERMFNGSTWNNWQRLGGQVLAGTGPTAAYFTASGHLYVAVVGTNHQIYLKLANGPGGFFSIGGQSTADPALTAVSSNTLAVFCRGTNGAGYYTRFTIAGGAAGWQSMGGKLTTGLSATSSPSTTYTFGLGTNISVFGDTGTWTSSSASFSGWKGF